jgi:hypothetical protein
MRRFFGMSGKRCRGKRSPFQPIMRVLFYGPVDLELCGLINAFIKAVPDSKVCVARNEKEFNEMISQSFDRIILMQQTPDENLIAKAKLAGNRVFTNSGNDAPYGTESIGDRKRLLNPYSAGINTNEQTSEE